MPAGTLCFTVLRNPVERIISQINAWRQYTAEHTGHLLPGFQGMIADSNRLPLREFLEQYGWSEGRVLFDNYMTRALAEGRLGRSIMQIEDADTLLDIAIDTLEKDYDVIALTEFFDISRNALCAMAGLPPAGEIAVINRSAVKKDNPPERADASDVLQALTHCDRIVYQRARVLFEERHRKAGESYNTQAFEAGHAARLLDQIPGTWRDGATFYSVRLPIIGSGFHGRDYAGTPSCVVWSGPAACLTLYVPTPKGARLSLLLWIRSYAAWQQRDQIRVRVDGQQAAHRFAAAEGCADLLTIEAWPARDFVRLDVEIDEALTSAEAGSPVVDERKRGILFEGYGWRLERSADLTSGRPVVVV
jgi:hypothetical protein